ncbi:ribosomal subunit interface protein [Candidatus Woesebacteria bacterium RIFCSPHIGHO2_01_FULL_41_10]|uniref:Ribosomal subunit interface protein n=1 Tax=Candidatus Woesebacteria bacterium RIFCSPHIGHO2_01_FULL_41_10 TaxID=1802500 RepID=A0A1F7YNX1_9BACT|nr:MAG: ribosomal subunit interface protein [Candidatus Woesebacteria bacterium RIFCSPHIGHO2_01_FULL_41_10]
MKLQISSPDLPLEGTVENYISKKLGENLEKFLKKVPIDERIADIHVTKTSAFEIRVSFDMMLPEGGHIFADEKADEFHKAVNELHDEVSRQLKRYKDKLDPQK